MARRSATLGDLRGNLTALLLAAGLMLGLGPAIAHAGGPGVTLYSSANPTGLTIPGSSLSGGDVPPTRYTRRSNPSERGTTVTLSGTSVRRLLLDNGIDPDSIGFVNIGRASGSQVQLTAGDLADPPPFADGPAVLSDDGSRTRFFRPVRGRYATNAEDDIVATADSGPLQMYVDGGDITVRASASPKRAEAGEKVTFTASVNFKPPGAQLSYEWDFGDGATDTRARTSHTYATAGEYFARVEVTGRGGSECQTFCFGQHAVVVRVGEPPKSPAPTQTTPGVAGGTGTGAGAGSGTGQGGQGGRGGGAAGTGTTPGADAKPEPKPEPKPFGTTISGVLIEATGSKVRKLPAGEPAGAPKGEQSAPEGDAVSSGEMSLGGLLALAALSLGALRERRGVRLRVA